MLQSDLPEKVVKSGFLSYTKNNLGFFANSKDIDECAKKY